MKKYLFVYVFLAICAMVRAQVSPAFPNGATVYTFGDNVNIRNSPSTDGGIVGKLRIGTPVKIVHASTKHHTSDKGVDMPWYLVEFEKDGKTQKGYAWGGLLTLGYLEWSDNNGKPQQLMLGFDSYEEPGMFGGGYTFLVKWTEGLRVISSARIEDPFAFDGTIRTETRIIQAGGFTKLDRVFLIRNPEGEKQYSRNAVLYITQNQLHSMGDADSIFLAKQQPDGSGMMVKEFYSNGKTSIHQEYRWDGFGFVADTRRIFRDQLPVYTLPDTTSSVVGNLQLNDEVTVYISGGNTQLDKSMTVRGVEMNWKHISFLRDGKPQDGYVWEGYFTHAQKQLISPDGKKLSVWCGLKKKVSDNEYILDVKIRLEGTLYPVIPLPFASCGMEWGPYLFPEVVLEQKKIGPFNYALHIYHDIGCEGSDFQSQAYLFFNGSRWVVLQLPTSDYETQYKLVFPEDERGEAGKLVISATTGWENPVTTSYKKYTWDGNAFK